MADANTAVSRIHRRALDALKQHKYDLALELCAAARKLNTPCEGLEFVCALAWASKNNFPSAIEALKEELRLFPENQEARKFLLHLGTCPPGKAKSYDTMISERALLPLNQVEALAEDIPIEMLPKNEIYQANHFYGIARCVKHYLGLPESYALKATYTHVNYNTPWHCDYENPLPVCWVQCEEMAKRYREKTRKPAVAVGPPIQYAPNFYSEDMVARERQRLGRNLLLFPAHSTHNNEVVQSIEENIKIAERMTNYFDTVRFCIYWKDVATSKYIIENGFECVTAGHIFDPLFLSRLKAIFSVSDCAISTKFGAQIGISIYLDVPHILINIPSKYHGNIQLYEVRKTEEDFYAHSKYIDSVSRLFVDEKTAISGIITDEQKKIIDKYWGVSSIKTKKQLRRLVEDAEMRYTGIYF